METEGFQDNAACILAYLELFQTLSGEESARAVMLWKQLQRREAASEAMLAPVVLQERFGLCRRDLLLVMAALALEMDGALRSAFRRRYALELPSVEYGLQLIEPLCPSGVETLAQLAGGGALMELLLTAAAAAAYPLERPLILCRAALAFLTGLSFARVPGMTPLVERGEAALELHEAALEELRCWLAAGAVRPVYLCAPAGSGRRTLVRRACGGAVCVTLRELGGLSVQEREGIYREAAVTAALMSAPVCALAEGGGDALGLLEQLCRRHRVPLAVLVDGERFLPGVGEVLRLSGELTGRQKEEAWRFFSPGSGDGLCPEGGMTVGAMQEVAGLAGRYARLSGRGAVEREDVRRALRRRGGAAGFGIRYDVSASLEDMVLPESVLEQLELICQAARSANALEAWGLPRARGGVTAVFHGPSGTGKTMAAEAVAGSLGLPLLRADLSQLMDKYVGETEKHLARLLDSARENRCVLLFDEADSLFGKRSEGSRANDKYANLSTSYLLQEIERYEGVALLSTNLLGNFDEAFLRRLRYIVRFGIPGAAEREKLWRRALPPERVEGELPYAMLARAELSPARINCAARNAAVAALAQGRERVDTRGLLRALRLELEKSGKPLPAALARPETAGEAERARAAAKR